MIRIPNSTVRRSVGLLRYHFSPRTRSPQRRRSTPALLCLPLLVLACDTAPTQLASGAAPSAAFDIETEAAPLPTPLVVTCSYFGGGNDGESCDQDADGNFYDKGANDNNFVIGWNVTPATKGGVTAHTCQVRSNGTLLPASSCVNREGGSWVLGSRQDVPPSAQSFISFGTVSPGIGFRVKYTAKGSGFKNGTVIFTVFASQTLPQS